MFKQGHGGEVDIWSVGKLITDAANFIVKGLSQSMIDIGEQMKSEKSDDRPDAINARGIWSSLQNIF